jgi:cytochrome c556
MVAEGLLKLAAAGTLMMSLAAVALAQDMGPIESRQACMKSNGNMMKVMVPMIKGEAPYDNAAIKEALASDDAACAGWANWWGEDTKAGGAVKTRAKDEIWSDMAGFQAASMAYVTAKTAVEASADEASFKAAFPALGNACQGCHEKFRVPQN